jgi:FAD/FMN-containing dehydrogenase
MLVMRTTIARCISIVGAAGQQVVVPPEAIDQFRTLLRGELIEPGSSGYDNARKVYNGMIDKKPRLIARCVDVADVIAAVKFGRASGLRVSVRGGGHNAGGLGLTIDNLLAADVVLADGRFVVANAQENSDLFWALRGGGGNFGVVTSFLFKAHPVDTVMAGPMFWDLSDAADVMKFYVDFIKKAPENIGGWFAYMMVPPVPLFPESLHMKKVAAIVWCCTGSADDVQRQLAPVRQFRKPLLDGVGPVPLPALNSLFDGLYPPGLQWYWKADFVKELPDAAIAEHVKWGGQPPNMFSAMHLYPVNGAAHRVGKNDTAWSYRDAVFSQVIVGVDPDPANRETITRWARGYFDALHPYGAGGAYVNFMMEEGEDRVRNSYRDNYDRLAKVKAKYDPDNFFQVNQNIKPATA